MQRRRCLAMPGTAGSARLVTSVASTIPRVLQRPVVLTRRGKAKLASDRFSSPLRRSGEGAEAAAVEGEAVDCPEVDADKKHEATLRDAVAEDVLVPAVGAPQTGWRVDRFPQFRVGCAL